MRQVSRKGIAAEGVPHRTGALKPAGKAKGPPSMRNTCMAVAIAAAASGPKAGSGRRTANRSRNRRMEAARPAPGEGAGGVRSVRRVG